MQIAELHFSQVPQIDAAAIRARAEQILGETLDQAKPAAEQLTWVIFHRQGPDADQAGGVPPSTSLMLVHQPIDLNSYEPAIQQSWRFRDARSALAGSRHTLVVAEMMGEGRPPAERLRRFHGVVQAVVEHISADALVFTHAQQVVQPADYLAGSVPPIQRPGALNVRFFNISDTEGDMLMDTRGLTEVGLPDLQCHFRGLEPSAVAAVLYNIGAYLVEAGPLIQDGHTVAGATPDQPWRCQHENALVDPERVVLDLDPGPPWAAGTRHM